MLRHPGSRYFGLETCPETMAWVWGWFYAPNRGGWSLLGRNAKIHRCALLAEAVVGLGDGDLHETATLIEAVLQFQDKGVWASEL